MAGTEGSLDLSLYGAVGMWEVGREIGVVDMLTLEELFELIRSEWRVIVSVDSVRGL